MRQDKSFPINPLNGRMIGAAEASPPAITVDYQAYAHFLDDSGLTEAQKQALLQSLWNIVVGFVSLGFNVHPGKIDGNACGQVSKSGDADTDRDSDAVSWINPQLIYEFETASAGPAAQEADRSPHEPL